MCNSSINIKKNRTGKKRHGMLHNFRVNIKIVKKRLKTVIYKIVEF